MPLLPRHTAVRFVLAAILAVFVFHGVPSVAQNGGSFPPAVFTAKTVAVVNNTSNDAVEQGAIQALRAWGQFRVIDDPETADLTLRFDKSKDHDHETTSKTDANGNPSDYSFSMSMSSSIRMKAYVKDADGPFYSTKTTDSKNKAGMSCVEDLRNAYRMAHP
jgi:hypothetical protein